jgi:micrococcal nuclease
MYNKDVIKKGYARVAYIYPPNTDHLSELKDAQSFAESQNLGIWSLSGYVTADGYSLTKSCDFAKRNGYSTRGCGTTTVTTTTKPKPKPHITTTVSTSVAGSSLNRSPGQYASVTVKTKPGAQGAIEVDYNSGPSTAQGLYPKTADSNGNISWTWKVGTRTAPGTYPVIITVNGSTITKTLTVY